MRFDQMKLSTRGQKLHYENPIIPYIWLLKLHYKPITIIHTINMARKKKTKEIITENRTLEDPDLVTPLTSLASTS